MKTIDLTPTWSSVLPILLAGLESGTEVGQKSARDELHRMARILDGVVADKRINKTICVLASVSDGRDQERLDLIQRLAGWDSTKGYSLDSLIDEAAGLEQTSGAAQ